MSRSGYNEDCDDNWQLARWRGQIMSAIRGKRGQAFLRELIEALDAMPEKRLIENDLRREGEVCALGCVGARRGIALEMLDPEDYHAISNTFNIAHQMVREIEWINDEAGWSDAPEARWQRVRDWAERHLKERAP